MKQKAVKYHGPIDAKVCWPEPPKRSGGNAQENNQIEVNVRIISECMGAELQVFNDKNNTEALFVAISDLWQWANKHWSENGFRFVIDHSDGFIQLFNLTQLIANIFHYLRVYFVAKNKPN